MEIRTIGNVKCEKAFVLIGYGSRNSKRVKSYGRLKNRESDEGCNMITKTKILQKHNRTFIYTYNFIMEIPTIGNIKCERAFVLIGYGSRNPKWVKSYSRLKNKELGEDCSVITKTWMLQKNNQTVFYAQKLIMEIPTVRNVEREKAFVLIGYGSRNSKRVKRNGRLKNIESGESCSVITKTSML